MSNSIHMLSGMHQSAPQDAPRSDREAAEQIEMMFTKMLVKEIQKSLPEEGVLGGGAGGMFQDIFNEQISKNIQEAGGLGMADAMEAAMAGRPAATPASMRNALSKLRGEAGRMMPVQGKVTSHFGNRKDPIHGHRAHHGGMDISAPEGSPIRAVRGGTVTFSGERGGYGRVVIVDHGDGTESRYAHCRDLKVTEGDRISTGRVVGTVGTTGRTTGPHLHFELRKGGTKINPETYFGWSR